MDQKKMYEHREKAHNKLMGGSGGQNGGTDRPSVRMESRPSVAGMSGDKSIGLAEDGGCVSETAANHAAEPYRLASGEG